MGLVSRSDRGGHDVAWRRAVAGGVAIGLASALLAALGAADAPRWPLAGLPPAWWPGVTDLERLHAYGGLALGGLGAVALLGWALRARGRVGRLALGAAVALAGAAGSGVPIGWDGRRALVLPAGFDPTLGGVALDALEGLHTATAVAAPLLVLVAAAAATLQGRSGGLCRTVATLRDGLRPAIGRPAARLGAWAERH